MSKPAPIPGLQDETPSNVCAEGNCVGNNPRAGISASHSCAAISTIASREVCFNYVTEHPCGVFLGEPGAFTISVFLLRLLAERLADTNLAHSDRKRIPANEPGPPQLARGSLLPNDSLTLITSALSTRRSDAAYLKMISAGLRNAEGGRPYGNGISAPAGKRTS
ncbi:hypothetical protein [Bradyrhizobium jicamae]|uniref:hypothetical protein n=1 Tax=Bradyrhizobium jicamae TaxID=280332 RepID=UPI001BAA4424|nr:hypothetical protein [Bradyrhizobium jicamae]MBR0933072.1 hypothetical protein [Bradyrhizobium jicamae]